MIWYDMIRIWYGYKYKLNSYKQFRSAKCDSWSASAFLVWSSALSGNPPRGKRMSSLLFCERDKEVFWRASLSRHSTRFYVVCALLWHVSYADRPPPTEWLNTNFNANFLLLTAFTWTGCTCTKYNEATVLIGEVFSIVYDIRNTSWSLYTFLRRQ